MDKYIKRSSEKRSVSEPDEQNSSVSESKKANPSFQKYVASEKTVRKWIKDLNIDLEMNTEKDSAICMACKLC